MSASSVIPAIFGAIGSIAGSFVALAAERMPSGLPIGLARSRCNGCSTVLRPLELVPLLSFAIQRGRCRRCRLAIGWRSPAIELGGAGIGVAAALLMPDVSEAAAAALLGWWLLLLALLDADHFWLPSELTLPLIVAGLYAASHLDPSGTGSHFIGAAAGFTSLALIAALYRGLRGRIGLGGGDARLFAASGAWLGWSALPLVLALASLAGLAVALVAGRGRTTLTTRLPFGVFLGAATWLVYLAGP